MIFKTIFSILYTSLIFLIFNMHTNCTTKPPSQSVKNSPTIDGNLKARTIPRNGFYPSRGNFTRIYGDINKLDSFVEFGEIPNFQVETDIDKIFTPNLIVTDFFLSNKITL